MLGGRLFQTLIIRSLKMLSHIKTTLIVCRLNWHDDNDVIFPRRRYYHVVTGRCLAAED